MASRIGIALFGMGSMGSLHMQNMMASPRCALRWIVVPNSVEAARSLVRSHDLGTRCTTPDQADQVFADPSVDAVIIASSTPTHERLVRDSLTAGKAVFCEKPLTPELESTRACYDLAESMKTLLFCAFHRRFDPSVYKVYRDIRSGQSQLRLVKVTSRDYPFPSIEYLKISGGIFKDSTIHDIDMCGWLVGAPPKTIFAQGHAFNRKLQSFGDNDQVVVILTYENDSIAVIDNGRMSSFGYDQRLEVLCDKALLTIDNKRVDHMTKSDDVTTAEPRIERSYLGRYQDAYRLELEHFLDVLDGKASPRVTKEDTLRAMRIATLCKQSLDEGRIVDYNE